MNMLLSIVALVAVFGCAASASNDQMELDKETGLLMGNERLFIDYCMSSRAYIVNDVSQRARETSSALFNVFFGAATEIGEEILEVEKEAVEQLTKTMLEEHQPAKEQQVAAQEGPMDEEDVRKLIEEGKELLRESAGASSGVSRVLGRLVASTMTAGQAMISTANSALFVRLAKLRSQLSGANFVKGVAHTCQQVADYEARLEADLAEAKKSLKAENSEQELQAFVDQMALTKLNCNTTKFISRLSAFCDLLKQGTMPFFRMLGISPKVAEAIKEHTQN